MKVANHVTKDPLYKRMFNELTPSEQKIIKGLTDEDLRRLDVLDVWRDDHQPCVGIKVAGVPMGFWWLDAEMVGAFYFPREPRAQRMIREQIKFAIAGA